MSFDEHILLRLKAWMYGMLYFKCYGFTEWVWVGVAGFLVHTCVDVTHRILYDLGVKKVHGTAGDFVREFNQWYQAVKILYKCCKRVFASFPRNQERPVRLAPLSFC